jgi:hypothetical protein
LVYVEVGMIDDIDPWHVVSIVPPEDQGWLDCKEWCLAMISSSCWRYQGEGVFEFKHAKDALIFRLKWA